MEQVLRRPMVVEPFGALRLHTPVRRRCRAARRGGRGASTATPTRRSGSGDSGWASTGSCTSTRWI